MNYTFGIGASKHTVHSKQEADAIARFLESVKGSVGFWREEEIDPAEQVRHDAFLKEAQSRQEDGELEIDDNAIVSISSDGGAYVQAWIWIADEEAGLEPVSNIEGSV